MAAKHWVVLAFQALLPEEALVSKATVHALSRKAFRTPVLQGA